jgi:chemotaxis protein methyltransferase CheR
MIYRYYVTLILNENLTFDQHNLVTDRSFNEFHVILCRNVMIYFDSDLQKQVLRLLHHSLVDRGFMALGSRESILCIPKGIQYEEFHSHE